MAYNFLWFPTISNNFLKFHKMSYNFLWFSIVSKNVLQFSTVFPQFSKILCNFHAISSNKKKLTSAHGSGDITTGAYICRCHRWRPYDVVLVAGSGAEVGNTRWCGATSRRCGRRLRGAMAGKDGWRASAVCGGGRGLEAGRPVQSERGRRGGVRMGIVARRSGARPGERERRHVSVSAVLAPGVTTRGGRQGHAGR